jgi:5-carboxymethyl-2-hydroxymuconate isomerase
VPHITLEYTANIVEESFKELLLEIHAILSKHLPTDINNCKSRIIKHNSYLVSDGSPTCAFINIIIDVLPGRKEDLLRSIALKIKLLVKERLRGSNFGLDLQFSISVKNLPDIYYK